MPGRLSSPENASLRNLDTMLAEQVRHECQTFGQPNKSWEDKLRLVGGSTHGSQKTHPGVSRSP